MAPLAPGICHWCEQRHETCSDCGGETGCDDDGNATPEANPNGSLRNIAGIVNEQGNVLGMMPHPERACDPLLGGTDGNAIWEALLGAVGAVA